MFRIVLKLMVMAGLLAHPHTGCAACHTPSAESDFDVAIDRDHDHDHSSHHGGRGPVPNKSGSKCTYLGRLTAFGDSRLDAGNVSLHYVPTDCAVLADQTEVCLNVLCLHSSSNFPSWRCAQHQILLL